MYANNKSGCIGPEAEKKPQAINLPFTWMASGMVLETESNRDAKS